MLALRCACLCTLASASALLTSARPAARVRRHKHLLLLSEGPSSSDDDLLAAALRARREELERERGALEEEAMSLDQEPKPPVGSSSAASAVPQPPADGGFRFDTPQPAPPADSGGFRFEDPDSRKFVAGLDTSPDSNDMKLVRAFTEVGGRALTFITLASLVFYLYVGLSGGITDGFDRFSEPIEDIRVTMEQQQRYEYPQGSGYQSARQY